MMEDRGIDLSLLTESLFDDVDPRCFGHQLQIEITMRDLPPTIAGIHGALLCYNTDSNGLH